MALVVAPPQVYDAFAERFSKMLWVGDADVVGYPEVRTAKLQRRAHAARPAKTGTKDWWGNEVMLLTYDRASYEAEQKLAEAKQTALAKKTEVAPRPDVYVKGAMDWEKNAWKVWDKKKAQEEARRDRYSTAVTTYLAGHALTHRFEPPAVTQCAHCDIGGGIHPLRRCMGCMAVAYCCRAHQKVHWQWHKHICFAIRAANNLEAKRGEGAGWCKLRPRRWRRPPIEPGCIVETNVRARWANWKQFYTNGAQSMLNQMGDGGPFVLKEWDEAIASMAMCEEATFVFSVGATQRAMMPFVACRKAPPGTVLVCEVGLINVKRDGGRRQEVNDFLTQKFVAESRQKRLDRLDEQKFMRLRLQQDRKDKADSVMKLLKANLDKQGDTSVLEEQKDKADLDTERADTNARCQSCEADAAAVPPEASTKPTATGAAPSPAPSPAPNAAPAAPAAKGGDVDEWEEEPTMDYEGFGESDDFFAQEGDLENAPLNLPTVLLDDDDEALRVPKPTSAPKTPKPPSYLAASTFDGGRPGYVFKTGARGLGYYLDAPVDAWTDDEPAADDGAFGFAPWDPSAPSPSSASANSKPASRSAPPKKANDPWASVDAVETYDTRARDAAAAAKHAAEATAAARASKQAEAAKAAKAKAKASTSASIAPPPAAAPMPPPKAPTATSMRPILESLGLATHADAFEAAGLGDAAAAAALHRSDPQDFSQKLTSMGLKMGQRQKVVLAIGGK